jgi:hypothetical protein
MADNTTRINDFREKFQGGTRQNRFSVYGAFPSFMTEGGPLQDERLLVKAAQFPPATLGIIPVPFRGRIAKVPGDRQYLEWQIIVLDDAQGSIYKRFQEWNILINDPAENTQDTNWTDTANGGLTDWAIQHFDLEGSPLKTAVLSNCWPVEVGAIDLSYDAIDTVVEFPVTIAYDYYTTGGTSSSNTIPSGLR